MTEQEVKPEYSAEDKEMMAAGKRRFRKFHAKWHPDTSPYKMLSWSEQEKEVESKFGAKQVGIILNLLNNNILPSMCVDDGRDVKVMYWPAVDDIDDETLIYFPPNEKMKESRFIPIPETPEDFFELLEDYESGRMVGREYQKTLIQKEGGMQGNWARKMRDFIDFVRNHANDLETLKKMVTRPPRGAQVPILHTNAFSREQLYSGVTIDGQHVFLENEVDRHALQIISEMAGSLSSDNEFANFLHEVTQYGFFKTDARIESNKIVRKAIAQQVSNAPDADALQRVRGLIENSGALVKLTPQVAGLIRHDIEKRLEKFSA